MESEELFNCRPRLLKRLEEEKAKPEPDAALVGDISTALQLIEEDYATTISDFNMLNHHGLCFSQSKGSDSSPAK